MFNQLVGFGLLQTRLKYSFLCISAWITSQHDGGNFSIMLLTTNISSILMSLIFMLECSLCKSFIFKCFPQNFDRIMILIDIKERIMHTIQDVSTTNEVVIILLNFFPWLVKSFISDSSELGVLIRPVPDFLGALGELVGWGPLSIHSMRNQCQMEIY